MNARPHRHQAELRHGYGRFWYVMYGDQTIQLKEEGDPYTWPETKREELVGAAVLEAVRQHDRVIAVNQHFERILNPPRRPWWKFW